MKILIVTPSFAVHGGIRIIVEWANRLNAWHHVDVYSLAGDHPEYFNLEAGLVPYFAPEYYDKVIFTSPHSVALMADTPVSKAIVFIQMLEHHFNPDRRWQKDCHAFYRHQGQIIAISEWNAEYIRQVNPTASIEIVGNGVNLQDFPISSGYKDGRTVLVEGWEGYNPAKDIQRIGPQVAASLRASGYRIIAFGGLPIRTDRGIPHEYHHRPSLELMNQLYSDATILLKVSRYDARACAPMEAMTKGTVTVRGLIHGDDDLKDGLNCVRVGYNARSVAHAATELLRDEERRLRIANNCVNYVREFGWDYWMPKINEIICRA